MAKWGLRTLLQLSFSVFIISCNESRMDLKANGSPGVVGGTAFGTDDTLPSHVVLIKAIFTHEKSMTRDFSYCTGVLIEDHFVLTAAHCLKFENVISFEVIFPLSRSKEDLNLSQVIIHNDYTPENLNRDYDQLRDIALIKLNQKVPAPYASLKLLPKTVSLEKNVSFISLGFGEQQGSILKKPAYNLELKYANLETQNFNDSTPFFEVIQRRKGICFGDSGGPAVITRGYQNYVVGIAVDVLFNPSRIFETNYDRCLEKAIFLNTRYFSEWIRLHTSRGF